MIRRGFAAAALCALALFCGPLLMAQVNPGTSPLPGEKGGTGNAFMQFVGPSSPGVKSYTLPATTSTIAALGSIQTWTGAQSFTDGTLLLLGSSSGTATLHAPATSGGSVTFFTGNDTVAGLAATQTFTNKTIASSNNTLGAVIMGLGGDAAGDIYYNNGSFLTRLPKGLNGQALELVSGLPAWATLTGTGTVTSVTIAPGTGISATGTCTVTTTGTCTIAVSNALAFLAPFQPTIPTATTSTSFVMMGLGAQGTPCRITPVVTGKVEFSISGNMGNATNADIGTFVFAYGTGTAPANGAAATGTTPGGTGGFQGNGNVNGLGTPVNMLYTISGLTPSTAYWFDLQAKVTGGGSTVTSALTCQAHEIY
jgi:hypothetical protein